MTEKLQHRTVFASPAISLIVACALMGGCGVLKERASDALADKRVIPVPHYQILSVANKAIKLDTDTGQTWELVNSRWEPLATGQVQQWTRDANGNPVPKAECVTPEDPCTNLWLHKDPDRVRDTPSVGTVNGGLRFKGGDPYRPENWAKVN